MHLQSLAERRIPTHQDRPSWSDVLRSLREARGITQEGWACHLGVSRKTVQRWERGERVPDPGAEAGILAFCRERGLLRSFDEGTLAGLHLTADTLRSLLEEARLSGGGDVPSDCQSSHPPVMNRSNLPAPLSSFVGRNWEVAAVCDALDDTRLLTLTGVGGCGKSRLAQEVGRSRLPAYPHGVWLVELASLTDPTLVPQAVATALGVSTTERSPVTAVLTEHLAARQLLLLLDNCEHLLPACAELAERLLRACPRLAILATSRESLGVPGETVWRVPALSLADASCLFVERARLCQPDANIASAGRPVVEEICRRLDGIPLAIELAAARLPMLSIEQIAERLSDRLRLLDGGRRSSEHRHRTMRAALEWSYDLLTATEQRCLRHLSVFAGGFTLDAAEAVDGDDAFESLARLVEKSLIVAEPQHGAMRYRLLEVVRQFAGERMPATDATDARRRHRDWCLDLAEHSAPRLLGPEQGIWLDRLTAEHDNLRAAIAWSMAQGATEATGTLRLTTALVRFWDRRGHLHEGRQTIERALAAATQAPALPRARALHGAGWIAYLQGDYGPAGVHLARGLALFRAAGDRLGIADTLACLGSVAMRQDNHAAAVAHLDASLGLHLELGSRRGIGSVQSIRGLLALRQGDYAAARTCSEEALEAQRDAGNIEGVADVLEDLATVAGEQGDTTRQVALLEESLTLHRGLGVPSGVAHVTSNLGMAAWMRGDHQRALDLLDESLDLFRQVGNRRGVARVLANQSFVTLYQRDYRRTIALCRESLAIAREIGDRWAIGRYLPVLAGAMFGLGCAEAAACLFAAALAIRERLGTPLPPVVRPTHDRTVEAVRTALGEDRFAMAWTAGRAMPFDAAMRLAIEGETPG